MGFIDGLVCLGTELRAALLANLWSPATIDRIGGHLFSYRRNSAISLPHEAIFRFFQ
jgi:hypothetical protein